MLGVDTSRCIDAIHTRHVQIHQHEIRQQGLGQLDRFLAGYRFSDHCEIRHRREQCAHPEAKDGVIIGDEDTNRFSRLFHCFPLLPPRAAGEPRPAFLPQVWW